MSIIPQRISISMEKILKTVVYEDLTLKQFMTICMNDLWRVEEAFSGKRPMGNSGWKSTITSAISKKFNISEEEADKLILAAIRYMCL